MAEGAYFYFIREFQFHTCFFPCSSLFLLGPFQPLFIITIFIDIFNSISPQLWRTNIVIHAISYWLLTKTSFLVFPSSVSLIIVSDICKYPVVLSTIKDGGRDEWLHHFFFLNLNLDCGSTNHIKIVERGGGDIFHSRRKGLITWMQLVCSTLTRIYFYLNSKVLYVGL